MSTAIKEDEVMLCASCGTAGSDDIKLKKCTACYLVRYCSVKCQKDHRKQHKRECKKRAAELRDEILFKQPESSCYGDCPICCLPLPIHPPKSVVMACCSKRICNGCDHTNQKQEIERRLQHTCQFCRKAAPYTDEEHSELRMKRIEVNDPVAMSEMGTERCHKGDYRSAFEHWTNAAVLGDVIANYQLSIMYGEGIGVEKDEKRGLHHAEKAAIGGHPLARHRLGYLEEENGRMDRAAKHYTIAANHGHDDSLERVKTLFKAGYVSKDEFAVALRGHKAAIDATKSPQREEAAAFKKWQVERERQGI